MTLTATFSLVVLVLVWMGQIIGWRRPYFRTYLALGWWGSVSGIGAILLYATWEHYVLWQEGALTRFLLPPHQGINYFSLYILSRSIGPWLIAFVAAVSIPRILSFANRRFGERFFEKEEIRMCALGVFLSGYPGFLLYIGVMLIVGAALAAFYQMKEKGRAPLYFLWLPVALFVILTIYWLVPLRYLTPFNL